MRTTEEFRAVLKASEPKRIAAAGWILREGYKVEMEPMRCRPTFDQWREYSDGGDIWGTHPRDGVRRLFEVKGPSEPFTDRSDWPHKEFIVEDKGTFDRKPVEPYMYIFVAPDLVHAARLRVDLSRDSWYEKLSSGPSFPNGKVYYYAPFAFLTWFRLDENEK